MTFVYLYCRIALTVLAIACERLQACAVGEMVSGEANTFAHPASGAATTIASITAAAAITTVHVTRVHDSAEGPRRVTWRVNQD